MTDYESKLKLNHLLKIISYSDKISPLLTRIYKEEYFSKLANNNKNIVSVRCQNKKCSKIFIDSNDYEIINIKKDKNLKKNENKFKMNVKCNSCNHISSIKLE